MGNKRRGRTHLNGRAVADERRRHLEPARWHVTHSRLHVVGNPLDKVAAVLVLHVQHLLVDFLHAHAAAEDGGHGQVATVARVAGGHHVLAVEHLLRELGHGERAVLLGAAARQRCEAGHEEVEPREGNHVDGELPQVGVQLTC